MLNSYYGSYRTRKFSDIYPDVDTFLEDYKSGEIPAELTDDTAKTLYYLLYARYGNSHIAYDDENQFKYAMLSKIFMYGPSWEKRLDVQRKIRALSEEEILQGSKAIYNHAFNPSTLPTTDTTDELSFINDQNTTKYKKSKLDGYANLIALIETDVTERFIGQFKKLFITIVAPDYPLLYETIIEEEN